MTFVGAQGIQQITDLFPTNSDPLEESDKCILQLGNQSIAFIEDKTSIAECGSSPWPSLLPNSKPGQLSCMVHRQPWTASGLPYRAGPFL